MLQQQAALKEEYEKKKAPFFKSRYEVVTNAEGGIPNFWLTTLQNNYIIAEEIQQVYLAFCGRSSKPAGGIAAAFSSAHAAALSPHSRSLSYCVLVCALLPHQHRRTRRRYPT